jgi:nitrilase
MIRNHTVCAVQWAPEVLDLERGLMRARDAMVESAKLGAALAVFPETWLLGYPYWASVSVRDTRFTEARRLLQQQALTRDGEAMKALQSAAAEAGIAVVMGLHERAGGTIYNAAAFIGSDGTLLNLHRKLVPTTTERLVWGQGDGSDMAAVDVGGTTLNGLICFEHQMALARHALATTRVQIHAALWPGHAFIDGVVDASTRHLAHENSCFVVVAREVMDVGRLGKHLPDFSDEPERWRGHGGSAIIGPNGTYLTQPVFDQEAILVHELDLSQIDDANWWFDGVGHYARPDVFRLHWDDSVKTPRC